MMQNFVLLDSLELAAEAGKLLKWMAESFFHEEDNFHVVSSSDIDWLQSCINTINRFKQIFRNELKEKTELEVYLMWIAKTKLKHNPIADFIDSQAQENKNPLGTIPSNDRGSEVDERDTFERLKFNQKQLQSLEPAL